jgi:hypothetical protein
VSLPLVLMMCCSITGYVRAISGTPLTAAGVEVRGGAHASTDAPGNFARATAPGRFAISAAARGYAPPSVTVDKVKPGSTRPARRGVWATQRHSTTNTRAGT